MGVLGIGAFAEDGLAPNVGDPRCGPRENVEGMQPNSVVGRVNRCMRNSAGLEGVRVPHAASEGADVDVYPFAGQDRVESFDRFFAGARGRVVGVAYALTGDLDIAQDLAQDALVAAWERWEEIAQYDNPEAWTMKVVHNLAISRWRRMRHIRKDEERGREVAYPGPGPDALVLAAALRSLPLQQQRAIVLHDGVGVPVAELAKEFGVPEGTIKAWLSRGRTAIAKILRLEEEKS